MNTILKIVYNVFFGIVVVTGVVVIFGIPVSLLLDRIFSISPFFSSQLSGDILLGLFILLIVIGFFLRHKFDIRSDEEIAKEQNPFIK